MAFRRFPLFIVIMVVGLLAVSTTEAQPNKPWKSWFGHFAAAYTIPTSRTGTFYDDGWSVLGGATYKPEEWPAGVIMELSYTEFDLNSEIVNMFQEVDDGEMNIWQVTGGGIWSTKSSGVVNFSLSGQVGWYRVYQRVSTRIPVVYPPGCGWWWCWPGGVGTGSSTVASDTDNTWGANLGAALTFTLGNDSQIYLEARWNYAATDITATEFVPILIGYKW